MNIQDVKNLETMLQFLHVHCSWNIDVEDIEDIEDITYGFDADDIGLKQDEFYKIKELCMIRPLVENQPWGIFSVEFDSDHFEVKALRKILSGLIPRRRNINHAVWDKKELIFFCFWGEKNNRAIGIAHFDDSDNGLPIIKINYCSPAVEDEIQIKEFEEKIKLLKWPESSIDVSEWERRWANVFGNKYRQVIRDSQTLISELAVVARTIQSNILEIMRVETSNGYVHLLYEKFRDLLIHDLSNEKFADMYAQTVVYGLFSAKCMGNSDDVFEPAKAIEQIPNTNPFLRSLLQECFSNSTGKLSFDELGLSDIVDVLRNAETEMIIGDFNRQTGGGKEDPVIYFYEGFLDAYEKEQKKRSGVYYTPSQVVNFMIRSVDLILRNEFAIKDGLASDENRIINVARNSKTKVNGLYKTIMEKKEVPAVQILDPATGTGTFLRQIILQIYATFKKTRQFASSKDFYDKWNVYVDECLLPRINGYELMMAPYAVAHMKLAMLLKQLGYRFEGKNRLNIFLTNSLEKAGDSEYQMTLWSDPLASEAIEANKTKKNQCINVCIGNPPYNAASQNMDEWIMELLKEYKMEPGGIQKLNERNPKWLNDDYVKFIRLCEKYISESGQGILAFINPHGFIDNPTFRGMRWDLLRKFDRIYILDLHGNSNRQEKCPDGSKDENVFDIQQGVSINIFIKSSSKSNLMAEVYHADLWGDRGFKFDFLKNNSITTIDFNKVEVHEPEYNFKPTDLPLKKEYNKGFSIEELFSKYSVGIVTAKDGILIDSDEEQLKLKVSNYYGIEALDEKVYPIYYRPLDKQYIYYDPALLERSRENIMKEFYCDNLGLITARSNKGEDCSQFLVTDMMSEAKCGERTTQSALFPLYLHTENMGEHIRIPNLNMDIIHQIENILDMKFVINKRNDNEFIPEDILGYIYGSLYSIPYREKYKTFINAAFPRVSYPQDRYHFEKYVDYGKQLMRWHLMNDIPELDYQDYHIIGHEINKITYKNECVFIDKDLFFDEIPEETWNFIMCGYQPMQKWMKDRRGKLLTERDVKHYRKMQYCIEKTIKIMEAIKKEENANGRY